MVVVVVRCAGDHSRWKQRWGSLCSAFRLQTCIHTNFGTSLRRQGVQFRSSGPRSHRAPAQCTWPHLASRPSVLEAQLPRSQYKHARTRTRTQPDIVTRNRRAPPRRPPSRAGRGLRARARPPARQRHSRPLCSPPSHRAQAIPGGQVTTVNTPDRIPPAAATHCDGPDGRPARCEHGVKQHDLHNFSSTRASVRLRRRGHSAPPPSSQRCCAGAWRT